ncbi:MAG: hypothetical protein KKH04_13665 [Proteobacteria bacterium]|nr:hypothetical protein [Pseudomonadota bacterium]
MGKVHLPATFYYYGGVKTGLYFRSKAQKPIGKEREMGKTGIRVAVSFLVVLGLLMAATITQAQTPKVAKPEVIHWKGQSFTALNPVPFGPFPAGYAGASGGLKMWMEWLKQASGGRLVIDWAEPGAIFPITEADIAVGKNVVQIALTYGGYYAGRIPESDIETSGVFQWENEAQQFECLHKYGLYGAIQKAYAKHNLKWIPFHSDAIVGIGTTFPASNPASVKGKKIRALGMWSHYVHMLGGSPVSLHWGEIYMGMKLGTIDGWIAGVAALEDLKLKEVTKGCVYYPRISSATTSLIINMDAFKALPQDLQDLLDRDSPYITYAASSIWNNQCNWILKNSEKKYGMKLYAWSKEDADRLIQQAVDEIYPKIAAKSKGCAELLEIVKKQMKDYGRIK